ncbi:MAG TPA: hypothetical protein V6C96_02310 [Vampirovibrionales bacterium]
MTSTTTHYGQGFIERDYVTEYLVDAGTKNIDSVTSYVTEKSGYEGSIPQQEFAHLFKTGDLDTSYLRKEVTEYAPQLVGFGGRPNSYHPASSTRVEEYGSPNFETAYNRVNNARNSDYGTPNLNGTYGRNESYRNNEADSRRYEDEKNGFSFGNVLKGAGFGALTAGGFALLYNLLNGNGADMKVGAAALGGGAGGAVSAAGTEVFGDSTFANIATNAAGGAVGTLVYNGTNGDSPDGSIWLNGAINGVLGGIFG